MSNSAINRPFKYGAKDRREFIVQDSEVAVRVEYDVSGNPIYVGRAKVGSAEGSLVWQISEQTFDGSNNLTEVNWPQNSEGNASSNYEFSWTNRATYTYS